MKRTTKHSREGLRLLLGLLELLLGLLEMLLLVELLLGLLERNRSCRKRMTLDRRQRTRPLDSLYGQVQSVAVVSIDQAFVDLQPQSAQEVSELGHRTLLLGIQHSDKFILDLVVVPLLSFQLL